MAAISEKILWPVVAIFIFGILLGFYIDDRTRLAKEAEYQSPQQQASSEKNTPTKTSSTHAKASGSSKTNMSAGHHPMLSDPSQQTIEPTSLSIDEYLARSTDEVNQQLIANVADHQGFHGGIDEYLGRSASTTKTSVQSSQTSQTMSKPSITTSSSSASSMSMNEYLAKFANKTQTPVNKTKTDPFNQKEHMGFHGSYEEYAKKYN